MAFAYRDSGRVFLAALVHCVLATGRKGATDRQIVECGWLTFYGIQPVHVLLHSGYRGQQGLGVRM